MAGAIRRICFVCAVPLLVFLFPVGAMATNPMITSIPDQWISANESTDPVSFTISDNETPAWQMKINYSSNNREIVPMSEENITLGGSGANRTVTVTPLPDAYGSVIITIILTDNSGDRTQDSFNVSIARPSS
jgi:hypothetical protein